MRRAGIFIVTLTLGLGIAAAQRGGRGGGIPAPLKITIPAFADGGAIPAKYGCSNGTNANLSPAIQWSGAPAGTMSIALILHDPDVAIGGSIGYFNPCPPPPTTHHYMFEFYALDTKLDTGLATRADLLAAMVGHIRAKGVYFGLFHQ